MYVEQQASAPVTGGVATLVSPPAEVIPSFPQRARRQTPKGLLRKVILAAPAGARLAWGGSFGGCAQGWRAGGSHDRRSSGLLAGDVQPIPVHHHLGTIALYREFSWPLFYKQALSWGTCREIAAGMTSAFSKKLHRFLHVLALEQHFTVDLVNDRIA